MIVVDASVIVAFLMRHEFGDMARTAASKDEWTAPPLWRSEVRSSLMKFVRANRLSLDDAKKMYTQAEAQMWRENSVRGNKVLDYASKSQASVYDCEYVVLADDLGLKLVTIDGPLVSHFPNIAVHLRDYLGGTEIQ